MPNPYKWAKELFEHWHFLSEMAKWLTALFGIAMPIAASFWAVSQKLAIGMVIFSGAIGLGIGILIIVAAIDSRRKKLNQNRISINQAGFISMHDAATQFYDSSAKVGGISAQAASELGSLDGDASPNQKLDWIATYLSRKLDVYGIKPPSRTIGKIAKEDVRTAYFSDGAKFLRNAMYEKSIFWGDLAVRAEELPKVIDDHTEQKSAEDAFSRIRAN